MRKSHILTMLMVFGLLLFGCTGPSSSANDTPPSAEGNEQTSPAESPTGTNPAEPPPTQTPPTQTEQKPTTNFATETCFALMGSGVPVDCTMTTSYKGQSNSVRFWMQGDSNIRYEMSGQGSDCNTVVMIHTDTADYMGCKNQKWMGTSCDWYMVTIEEAAEGEPVAYESGSMDYDSFVASVEDLPTTECSCSAWVPDQSLFQASGKVCNEDEFMEELMGDFGAYQ